MKAHWILVLATFFWLKIIFVLILIQLLGKFVPALLQDALFIYTSTTRFLKIRVTFLTGHIYNFSITLNLF